MWSLEPLSFSLGAAVAVIIMSLVFLSLDDKGEKDDDDGDE